MYGKRCCPARRASITVVLLLLIGLLAPIADGGTKVGAATDLTVGGWAMIANADGDNVLLRVDPGWSQPSVGAYPEGTVVEVLDGPYEGDEAGTLWYQVAVDHNSGFIAEIYLVSSDGSSSGGSSGGSTGGSTGGDLPAVIGSATIINTGGDSIRCRSMASVDGEILYWFAEGEQVELTGDPVDGWQPVICGGVAGFVSSEFIGTGSDPVETPTPTETPSDSGTEITGSAVIFGTNGDGARCRSEADTDAPVITVLVEGTAISLRGPAQGAWQPIVCEDQPGFVSLEFVGDAENLDDVPGESTPEPTDDGNATEEDVTTAAITGMGEIRNTNGDNVRCRAKANLSSSIITLVREGDQLQLRGSASGTWQPVYCDGQKGFIHTDYIGPVSSGGGSNSGGNNGTGGSGNSGGSGGNTGGGSNSSFSVGDKAVVSGTNGDGVRFRSKASFDSSIISVVGEGQGVVVRAGSTGDWVAVTYKGSNGFIHMDYLSAGSASGGSGNGGSGSGNGSGNGSSGGSGSGTIGAGSNAMVTEDLRVRDSATKDGQVLAIAAASTVVEITGSKKNGFYPVDWDGLTGWMYADYLTWSDAPVTPRQSGVGGDAGSAPGSADGQELVDYAKNYLGYPYVWATHGPKTFDCSGFTYWVTLHILGEDIGTGTWTQSVSGTPVAYGDLQPGDLVFFQNTFTWGLSHVGIYIGNNQFIHAENETTGIKISSLTSPYYSSRWYGARRLT